MPAWDEFASDPRDRTLHKPPGQAQDRHLFGEGAAARRRRPIRLRRFA
jgi:hypothetical protein